MAKSFPEDHCAIVGNPARILRCFGETERVTRGDIMIYRQCTRCIMDTTDPEITFDYHGVCNHCRRFDKELRPLWWPNAEGRRRLEKVLETVRREGQGKEYDCIIGLSGGVDSSYMAYQVVQMGLRPLVMHVDGG